MEFTWEFNTSSKAAENLTISPKITTVHVSADPLIM